MVDKNIVLKKISQIRHNLARLKEKENIPLSELDGNLDVQDIILYNLQLTIQGCVDIGTHVISDNGWGTAGSLNEVFYLLQEREVIKDAELVERLVSMVGFRNILVHEYQKIDFGIVHNVLKNRLIDIERYLASIINYCKL